MSDRLNIPSELVDALARIDLVIRQYADATTPVGIHLRSSLMIAADGAAAIAGLPQCRLGIPYSRIAVSADATGGIHLQCEHAAPHRWSLNGHRRLNGDRHGV